MGHFNNDRRGGEGNRGGGNRGGFGGNRGGGGGGRGGFGGNRGGGAEMFRATCADCGKSCEVPFKPMHGKAVYCNNCFKRDGDSGNRSERRDFSRPRFEDKQMHSAVCDECGKRCEIPFKPTGGKPVFCKSCFDGGGEVKKADEFNEQFEALNKKLDKALRLLDVLTEKKTHVISKAEDDSDMDGEEEAEKPTPKKKAAKKTPAKKTAAKKTAAKKASVSAKATTDKPAKKKAK